jgi:hypothetical protein
MAIPVLNIVKNADEGRPLLLVPVNDGIYRPEIHFLPPNQILILS